MDILVGGKENDGPPQYDDINWHKQMLEEGHLYTYMQKNGEIIGGAILFEEGRKLYVGRIFIIPQHFGQGYGIPEQIAFIGNVVIGKQVRT